MDETSNEPEVVFQSRTKGPCMEARFVLESVGIRAQSMRLDGQWCLLVPPDQASEALRELAGYQRDLEQEALPPPAPVKTYQGAVFGVVGYVAILIAVAAVSSDPETRQTWVSAGKMLAGEVMAGQWSRSVTALTLHADVGHLLSNVGYGAVFGLLVGRVLGGGVGWLTILVAGALGNTINAFFRDADHGSIGASTAVFAALGVLVSHALRPRSHAQEKLMKRWAPLIGGVLLMAFTGISGERTDVGAHTAGFIAGMALGYIACRTPERLLGNLRVQAICGFVAFAIVVFAWVVAVVNVA